jgi:hypothetical protein
MLSTQGAIVNGAGAKAGPPPGTCTIQYFVILTVVPLLLLMFWEFSQIMPFILI